MYNLIEELASGAECVPELLELQVAVDSCHLELGYSITVGVQVVAPAVAVHFAFVQTVEQEGEEVVLLVALVVKLLLDFLWHVPA